jgi:hypothetical protein
MEKKEPKENKEEENKNRWQDEDERRKGERAASERKLTTGRRS